MNITSVNALSKQNNYAFKSSDKPASINVSNFINTDRMVDSFISLAKIDSGSNDALAVKKTPSTKGQKLMAKMLEKELKKIGLRDIEVDEYSIVTATLDSNIGDDSPVVAFLAHMDTSSDAPTGPVKPQIIDYKDGDIKLLGGTIIPEKDLIKYKGQKLITSDGTTLLGADDKAGIAEILESLRVFKEHPELKHPKIRIAFTPDEETGTGIDRLDVEKLGAHFAYTIDGDFPNVIENESFNACNPIIKIIGKSTHMGDAKAGGMIDSIKVATWFMNKLPKDRTPETTEKKQGYFIVEEISGKVGETQMNMLVRNHNSEQLEKMMNYLKALVEEAQERFNCKIEFDPNPKYGNVKKKLDEFPEVMKLGEKAIRLVGEIPEKKAIRGGTDGSNLSLRTPVNVPTANIGTGMHNYHSKSEFWALEEGKKVPEIIVNIAIGAAENAKKIKKRVVKIAARRV